MAAVRAHLSVLRHTFIHIGEPTPPHNYYCCSACLWHAVHAPRRTRTPNTSAPSCAAQPDGHAAASEGRHMAAVAHNTTQLTAVDCR